MNAPKIIRNVLLVFVAGSLLYFAIKEVAARRAVAVNSSETGASSETISPATKLIVYFFAEGKDCTTCQSIPLYTKIALDSLFPDELKTGKIVWRTVNVDDPRNAHFVTDYNLYTKSIVLVRVENGKQMRWKNLQSIWDLVYDKDAFVDYIRKEVRADLETAS